jgi:hypothetical protein
VAYHAFLTLFLDYSGAYEERTKRMFPLIFAAILVIVCLVVAPSGFFAISRFGKRSKLDFIAILFSQSCFKTGK